MISFGLFKKFRAWLISIDLKLFLFIKLLRLFYLEFQVIQDLTAKIYNMLYFTKQTNKKLNANHFSKICSRVSSQGNSYILKIIFLLSSFSFHSYKKVNRQNKRKKILQFRKKMRSTHTKNPSSDICFRRKRRFQNDVYEIESLYFQT